MPQFSTIVVPDAATTPVNQTFTPVKLMGDTAFLAVKSAVASIGNRLLSLTHRAPLAGQTEKVYRSKISLAIPVTKTETINGINREVLGYTNRATVEMVVSADATLQDRKDLKKILSGIINDASFTGMVESQENLY